MNKIVKIMSSVISWERPLEKGHCDLGFHLFLSEKMGTDIIVSEDGDRHYSLWGYLWKEKQGMDMTLKCSKNTRKFSERK